MGGAMSGMFGYGGSQQACEVEHFCAAAAIPPPMPSRLTNATAVTAIDG